MDSTASAAPSPPAGPAPPSEMRMPGSSSSIGAGGSSSFARARWAARANEEREHPLMASRLHQPGITSRQGQEVDLFGPGGAQLLEQIDQAKCFEGRVRLDLQVRRAVREPFGDPFGEGRVVEQLAVEADLARSVDQEDQRRRSGALRAVRARGIQGDRLGRGKPARQHEEDQQQKDDIDQRDQIGFAVGWFGAFQSHRGFRGARGSDGLPRRHAGDPARRPDAAG
jgi:hypothetical protein